MLESIINKAYSFIDNEECNKVTVELELNDYTKELYRVDVVRCIVRKYKTVYCKFARGEWVKVEQREFDGFLRSAEGYSFNLETEI